jgi:hypothetical protein
MEQRRKHELLNSLTRDMAISVLAKLCDDKALGSLALNAVETELRQVDADEVARAVFNELDALDVDDLNERSGKTGCGYTEPSDAAYEMAEEAITPFVRDIEKYRDLHMKSAEKEACRGLIRGLLLYDAESDNEFKDWLLDGAACFVDDIVYAYGACNSENDLAEIKSESETAQG